MSLDSFSNYSTVLSTTELNYFQNHFQVYLSVNMDSVSNLQSIHTDSNFAYVSRVIFKLLSCSLLNKIFSLLPVCKDGHSFQFAKPIAT